MSGCGKMHEGKQGLQQPHQKLHMDKRCRLCRPMLRKRRRQRRLLMPRRLDRLFQVPLLLYAQLRRPSLGNSLH